MRKNNLEEQSKNLLHSQISLNLEEACNPGAITRIMDTGQWKRTFGVNE